MINYDLVEQTIHAWAVALSGYSAAQVIWRDQDGNAPTGNYLTLHTGDQVQIGLDAITSTTNIAAPAGEEVTITVAGDREIIVTVECYTAATVGAAGARAILAGMLTKSSLPSMRDILALAGLSHFDQGKPSYVPAVKEINFQGRGVWESRMYARDTASEKTTYIERAEITDTVTGDVIVVDT